MSKPFLARMGDAFHVLAGTKAGPSSSWDGWAKGDDIDLGQGAKLLSPYQQSAWVYIAVSRLAEKVSSIPFRISQMDADQAKRVRSLRGSADPRHRRFVRRALGEQIVDNGDVVDLFNRPHPLMNRQLFWEMVVTWNAMRGEFFVLPLDDSDSPIDLSNRSARVRRMITLPTDMFYHIVEGYNLRAWRFTSSPMASPIPSEMLDPDEVIHSRTANPYDFWRGMSPLGVALLAAGSDYAAAQYAKGYWLNNADTGVIVTTEQILDPDQRKAIEVALRERKRKAGTADRPLFLFGGAKVEKPQLNGMEQQFISNREMNRQEVGAIFKVPESVMGFTGSKSTPLSGGGAAIESEQVQFIESTIDPLCAHLEAAVEPIVKQFGPGLVGWFDIDSLPVMQAARRARWDTATKMFGIGVPLNDANESLDLGLPEYPWGNKSFLPFNLQEVGASPEELPGEEDPEDDEGEGEAAKYLRVAKLFKQIRQPAPAPAVKQPDTTILWKSHVASRRKTVKVMQAKTSKVLNHYRGIALSKLAELHITKTDGGYTMRHAGSQQGVVCKGLVDLIFSSSNFGTSLANELTAPIQATLNLAGTELNQELGKDDAWLYPPKAAKDYLAKRTQEIMGVGGTVRDQLNTALQAGLDAGETTEQLAGRVRSVFNGLNDYEAKRVAMTETNMAYNDARHLAMTEAGIEYKAWLSSHGPNVREAHALAEEIYMATPIPVDEPFEVGGEELMYPGDDSLGASAGNIINCQCIQLAAQKQSEDAKSIAFQVYGVGLMTFSKN